MPLYTPDVGTSIQTAELDDGSVTNVKLAGSITTPKLVDGTEFTDSTRVAYKTIAQRSHSLIASVVTGAATYVFRSVGSGSTAADLAAGNNSGLDPHYLNPADYAITGRTTKYRIQCACIVNATNTGITFTPGLYPIASVAGGVGVIQATLGAVTSGSTVAFTTPLASTLSTGNSGDFTPPAAGYFVLGCATSGAMTANSAVGIEISLQVRTV